MAPRKVHGKMRCSKWLNMEYGRARISSPPGDAVMCNRALGVIQRINAEIAMANAAVPEEGETAEATETDEERIARKAEELAVADWQTPPSSKAPTRSTSKTTRGQQCKCDAFSPNGHVEGQL